MAATTRFGLHYQTLTDSPDGAGLGGLLAGDVDAWLARAYVVADANARTALTGLSAGFFVFQDDDDSLWQWSGSTWISRTATAGGGDEEGGALASVKGQYRASANQNISNNTDTVLGFGTTDTSSSVVTRATQGSGHKFTLTQTGTYAITATVRFAAGTAGSRFIELRNASQTTGYVADGDQGGPAAATRSFSITDTYSSGQDFVVVAAQTSGGTLATDYQGTSPTVYRVKINITLIG